MFLFSGYITIFDIVYSGNRAEGFKNHVILQRSRFALSFFHFPCFHGYCSANCLTYFKRLSDNGESQVDITS